MTIQQEREIHDDTSTLERGTEVLVEMDADASHRPEQLPRLLDGRDRRFAPVQRRARGLGELPRGDRADDRSPGGAGRRRGQGRRGGGIRNRPPGVSGFCAGGGRPGMTTV